MPKIVIVEDNYVDLLEKYNSLVKLEYEIIKVMIPDSFSSAMPDNFIASKAGIPESEIHRFASQIEMLEFLVSQQGDIYLFDGLLDVGFMKEGPNIVELIWKHEYLGKKSVLVSTVAKLGEIARSYGMPVVTKGDNLDLRLAQYLPRNEVG